MVQFRSVHYAPPRSRVLQVQFRQLFQARSLTMAIPLLACLLFSSMYGVQHAHSVAAHTKELVQRSQSRSGENSSSSSSATSKTNLTQTTNTPTNSTNSTNVNPSTRLPTTHTSPTSKPPLTKTLPGTLPHITTTSCDAGAKALATTTEQAALGLETSRHSAQVAILDADNITSLLLTGKDSTAMTAENNLHTSNIQKIEDTYQASLTNSNCL